MNLSVTLRIFAAVCMAVIQLASGNFVFNVTHKFAGKDKQLSELRSHDSFRHARMLANLHLPLAGDSRADSIGVHYNVILKGIDITARQPVKLHTVQETFACFSFTLNTDKAFPVVNLHFEDNLKMSVYPHDYLFSLRKDLYCFGWQSGGLTNQDGSDGILL
ncbi:hypothetical protein HID58_070836, partial [Brassica napus]